MKKALFAGLIAFLLIFSCRKESQETIPPEDRTQVNIELDGEPAGIAYSGEDPVACTMYSFGGVLGYYYGVIAHFELGDKTPFDIAFGTLLSDTSSLTEEGFLRIIAKGPREFGSLGAFSSYPRLKPNRVEISYTDQKNVKWCSSRIVEKRTSYGIEADVVVPQQHSEFVVDEVEKVGSGPDRGSYRLKGHFDCFLYQMNGNAKKLLKGNFVGVFSRPV